MLHCHIIWHSESGMALQLIERPDEIPAAAFTEKDSYRRLCAAEEVYEAQNPSHKHSESNSGI
jgi:hypothetical protein